MTFHRTPGPTPGVTYQGFAGQAPPPGPTSGPPPKRRVLSRNAVMAGVAGAVGLGLVVGVIARPDFGDDGRAREPMRPATEAARATQENPTPEITEPDEGMEILVNAPVIVPPPPSASPMEVMSQDLIRAAPRQGASASPRAPTVRAAAPDLQPRGPSGRQVATAPPPAPAASGYRRAAVARPSFDCGAARSRAEQLVCSDAELAAADRRLDRAYRQAMAAGIPARVLRAYQDDWLLVREDAARDSAQAVAGVYAQRTQELQDLADEPSRDDLRGVY